MSVLGWAATVGGIWSAASVALALVVGPVLARRGRHYRPPPAHRRGP